MNYELVDRVAIITVDDGKANVVGPDFLDAIGDALDRAEREKPGALILQGREGMFSAGFDLREFKKGPAETVAMVSRGMQLLIRLYSFPLPLVAACTGHGIAMGAFILLACDTRVGTRGPFKLTLPETAISMEVPGTAMALATARIPLAFHTRSIIQSESFDPDYAVAAGFLDEAVEPAQLSDRAMAVAVALAQLPQAQYAANKLALRRHTLAAMQAEFESAFAAAGARGQPIHQHPPITT